MTGGQLNDDGGIDRAVRCIAIKLGSLEAITKQMQRKSLNPLADAALDCQISQEELKPFLSLLDRPIRSDFSVYRCTTQCESSLDSFSKVAEKIKVPSVLPLQGVVFVGRKDLFATDQVVTPERGATFGIDVQAQNFAALDAGMLDDMFSKESSSKSWSNFFRKALYVTIWSLVLAVTWGVSAMSSTGTQRLIQKYRTKTTTKTKDSKSSLNLMLRNSVFWLVVVVLRTIIVLLGVSLLMICAFLFIGNELFDIRTVNDDIAFTFVTTLLISFGIESILLVASGVEHGTEVASKTLINLKEYVERFRTFLHKGVDK